MKKASSSQFAMSPDAQSRDSAKVLEASDPAASDKGRHLHRHAGFFLTLFKPC